MRPTRVLLALVLVLAVSAPAGWLMLNGRFFLAIALMLWSSGSLFLISSGWLTMMPNTRG